MKEQKYRMLKVGEVIQKGDEINTGFGQFLPTNIIGHKVQMAEFRRPIKRNSSRRQSKHERLLKALLKKMIIKENAFGTKWLQTTQGNVLFEHKSTNERELIAIKEAMEKKARNV